MKPFKKYLKTELTIEMKTILRIKTYNKTVNKYNKNNYTLSWTI